MATLQREMKLLWAIKKEIRDNFDLTGDHVLSVSGPGELTLTQQRLTIDQIDILKKIAGEHSLTLDLSICIRNPNAFFNIKFILP